MNIGGRDITVLAVIGMVAVGAMLVVVAFFGAAVVLANADLPAPNGVRGSVESAGVNLSWTAPQTDLEITGYRVLRRSPDRGERALGTVVSNTKSTSTTWTDTDVKHGERYIYRLKVLSNNQQSKMSALTKIVWNDPDLPEIPGQPPYIGGAVNADGVSLIWSAASDGGAADGYQILRRSPSQDERSLAVHVADTGSSATQWTDTYVDDGERYIYRVKGLNKAGAGPSSRALKIKWEDTAEEEQSAEDAAEAVTTTGPYVTPLNEDTPVSHEKILPLATVSVGSSGSGGDHSINVGVGPLVSDDDSDTKDYILNFQLLDADGNVATACQKGGLGGSVHLMTVPDRAAWQYRSKANGDCTGRHTVRLEVLDGDANFIDRIDIEIVLS